MRTFALAFLLALAFVDLSSAQTSPTFGSARASAEYRNLFGWHVGDVDVEWNYFCLNCNCSFFGAPTISESLPIQECSIINTSFSPFPCGTIAGCATGVMGQKVVLVIECCAEIGSISLGVFCVSHQETFYACP